MEDIVSTAEFGEISGTSGGAPDGADVRRDLS